MNHLKEKIFPTTVIGLERPIRNKGLMKVALVHGGNDKKLCNIEKPEWLVKNVLWRSRGLPGCKADNRKCILIPYQFNKKEEAGFKGHNSTQLDGQRIKIKSARQTLYFFEYLRQESAGLLEIRKMDQLKQC